MWEEDQEVLKRQRGRIISLTKDKLHMTEMITSLKEYLSNTQNNYNSLSKSVHFLSSGTNSLDDILSKEKVKNDKQGIGFSEENSASKTGSIVFLRTSEGKCADSVYHTIVKIFTLIRDGYVTTMENQVTSNPSVINFIILVSLLGHLKLSFRLKEMFIILVPLVKLHEKEKKLNPLISVMLLLQQPTL